MSLERNECQAFKLFNFRTIITATNCKQRMVVMEIFFKDSNDVVEPGGMELVNYKSHLGNTYMKYLAEIYDRQT